jgi:hypothetical protein
METPKTSSPLHKGPMRSLALACSYALLSIIALIVLRLDFSKSTFSGGDLLYMLPSSTWVYLILLPIGILAINKVFRYRSPWLPPLALTLIFTVFFPLMQYPSIHHWDYFTHSTTSKYIVDYGSISSTSGYLQYPGAFTLLAILSEVLGLHLLITNLLLFSFLNLVIAILLVAMSIKLIGAEKGWLVPMVYFSFSFSHYQNFLHFSPALVGFCLYILFVQLALKTVCDPKSQAKSARPLFVLWGVLVSALTIIHPFTSFVSIVTLFCIYLLGTKIRSPLQLARSHNKLSFTLPFTLLAIVLFLSWNIFVASEIFRLATSSLISHIMGFDAPVFVEHLTYNPIPGGLSVVLLRALSLYRYGIYALFGGLSVFCIALYRRKAEVKLVALLTFGILIETILVYLTPATFGITRLILYSGVPVSILVCYLMRNVEISRVSRINMRLIMKGLEKILPFLFIGTFLVSNLYVCTFTQFVHEDEVSAAQFVVRKFNSTISLVIDESFIIKFYASAPLQVYTIDERTPSDMVQEIQKGSSSLEYLPKQRYYYNLSFVEGNGSLVYSNGLARVYWHAPIETYPDVR